MDRKVELVEEFYAGLPKDRCKVETAEHGFGFLEETLNSGGEGGMRLEYGERVLCRELHKYKFANVPRLKMDELLLGHVRKGCNVCLYFAAEGNRLFAFNLDNHGEGNHAAVTAEMTLAVSLLREVLAGLGCEPLIVASGKGYHLWCRLDGAVSNEELYKFMLRTMAKALHGVYLKGLDHQRINARFYPDPRTVGKVSLRLFGSDHPYNKVFSRVLTRDGLLDEEGSWKAFEEHLRVKTIGGERFREACEVILVR